MKNWGFALQWPIPVCLLHALLVSGIWLLVFKFDLDVLPGKLWMILALSWIAWLGALAVSQGSHRKRWAVAIVVGIVILAPSIPTLYTFLIWSIQGFAP